jgi:hypothetical protein
MYETSYKISTQLNTSAIFALLLSPSCKFMTIYKKNIDDANIFNVSFHVLYNTHPTFCPYAATDLHFIITNILETVRSMTNHAWFLCLDH